ncbi:hypothetical protein ABII15_23685 [Streptomyces sp. HUAS MG91]|uniref:Uncharacterized protein n=1 Tax=Streptomyces tabacisoli TaxID=3156398 RepID=A0AAU8IX12_9ACTN
MMQEAFRIPLEAEFLEEIGVEPVRRDAGDTLELNLSEVTGESLFLTTSETGRSVRIKWGEEKGEWAVDIFREGATCMRIDSQHNRTSILIDFSLGATKGELKLQIFPRVAISDQQLFSQ